MCESIQINQTEKKFPRKTTCELQNVQHTHYTVMPQGANYRHLLHNCGVFLCDVFLMFFLNNFKSDCIFQTLFLSKRDAVKSVWLAFENYVTV